LGATGVSKGKLAAPAPFLLAFASILVTIREGVAVGGEFICSDLKLVVINCAGTALLDIASDDEKGR